MAKFPSDGTELALLNALTGALRDLNEIRLFSIPNEAKRIAELKRDLRRQDRSSGGTAEETSAD